MTEDRFLAALFATLPPPGKDVAIPAGDDCAGILLGDGAVLLIAADQVIGDRHFVLAGAEATPPELAGRKLLARNVSDIGAMGGTPTQCLVCGAFGPQIEADWMMRFHTGIAAFAEELGMGIIGGDLARTPQDTVCSLTILGRMPADEVVLRSGARAGDALLATGGFGDSLATGHHLTFPTRWREGRWLAATRCAGAMIDVSDGLLRDAGRLCRASGLSLELDVGAVPLRTPGRDRLRAFADGEDYELLVAVSPAVVDRVLAEWPFPAVPLTRIGVFRPEMAETIVDTHGRPLGTGGFDHFAG